MNELKKLLAKLKLPHGLGGMQPARDWFIMLTLSLIALVVSVLWNVFFFTSALNDQAAPASDASPTTGGRSALPALEELFDARAADAIRFENASFVDPSL